MTEKQIYQVRSRYFHLAFERLFLTFRSRDHYDTKHELLMRTSRNEEEEKKENSRSTT
jgi:hypothetical protein